MFKGVGVFYLPCSFFWVEEEETGPWKRKMPVSASQVALIRDDSLPSQPFKDLLYVARLAETRPKKNHPCCNYDQRSHHAFYIIHQRSYHVLWKRNPSLNIERTLNLHVQRHISRTYYVLKEEINSTHIFQLYLPIFFLLKTGNQTIQHPEVPPS